MASEADFASVATSLHGAEGLESHEDPVKAASHPEGHEETSSRDTAIHRDRPITSVLVRCLEALETPFRRLNTAIKPMKNLLWSYIILLIFTILYCLFIRYVLIGGVVEVGWVFFKASTANLLVSIFSQLFVILAERTVKDLFGHLRLALAARPGGSSLATFFGIGPASEWLSTLKLAFRGWFVNMPCNARLVLPVIGLAFGSALKFQAEWSYYFVRGPITTKVYAGLMPVVLRVIDVVPVPEIVLYFASWTGSLLNYSAFAIHVPFSGCVGKCRSVLLPGGLQLARLYASRLDKTIFGSFTNAETVQIKGAPGRIMTFQELPPEFAFDPIEHCLMAGRAINDTLKVCVRQIDHSLALGWAACPQKIYDRRNCSVDTSWSSGPMKWATNVTAYEQFTDTAYNFHNFSIVDAQLLGDPVLQLLNATEYMKIFEKIFFSTPFSDQAANSSINSFTSTLTWLHRTTEETFPDDNVTLVSDLHNFVAVIGQFMSTAVQFCNYTVPDKKLQGLFGDFPLPENMAAVATNGYSSSWFQIQTWTGWTFIAAAAALNLIIVVGFIWIMTSGSLPQSTGFDEIDMLANVDKFVIEKEPTLLNRAGRKTWDGGEERQTAMNFEEFADQPDISSGESTFGLVGKMKGWRVKYVGATVQAPES